MGGKIVPLAAAVLVGVVLANRIKSLPVLSKIPQI